MRSSLVMLGLLILGVGCGEPKPDADFPTQSSVNEKTASSSSSPSKMDTAKPITSLRRAAVKETIKDGLGVFLQNIRVEDDPVFRGGKFLGFRLSALNPEWGVDLKPGDVILKVNGMPIEHPEDADAALRSLEKAQALRVDYERDGKPRTLELPITD